MVAKHPICTVIYKLIYPLLFISLWEFIAVLLVHFFFFCSSTEVYYDDIYFYCKALSLLIFVLDKGVYLKQWN